MTAIKKQIKIGECRLILGDCNEVMPLLGRFDAVVTDPPYGIGENSKKAASREKKAEAVDYGEFDWDKVPATSEQIQMMRAISKHQIIFGGNYFEGLPPSSCILVWDKENGKSDFADAELAWTNLKQAVRLIRWQWSGMIRKGEHDTRDPSYKRVHPTQKPVEVMRWAMSHLPSNARTILDPFMGSGTTLVACARLGLRGTGIEMNEQYFDAACQRVEKAYAQADLFVAPPKKQPKAEQGVMKL